MQKLKEKKMILLVDDFEFYLETAAIILKDKYEIITASSGQEAIEYLLGGGKIPDLILLDIVMPEMDGWVTYSRLKEISSEHNVPIAFVTSMFGTSVEKHAYDIGIADFITKPYNKNDLLTRIEKIFNVEIKES